MSVLNAVMASPRVYRFWQAPFADRKLQPALASPALSRARRVLDVACGPGTNAKYFAAADYVGVDINESYIRYARRRHGRMFVAADMLTSQLPGPAKFDGILVNSFLHHLDDAQVCLVLARLRALLTEDGTIHLLELVLPERAGPARLLARWDRGRHARPLAGWHELLSGWFRLEAFEPYLVGALGVPLWHMVYCRGRLS